MMHRFNLYWTSKDGRYSRHFGSHPTMTHAIQQQETAKVAWLSECETKTERQYVNTGAWRIIETGPDNDEVVTVTQRDGVVWEERTPFGRQH